jgi:sulfide:quinone oxidoreductase
MSTEIRTGPRRVVVVGGGIAAAETVMALASLAPSLTDVVLIAPDAAFTLRPYTVLEPFAGGPLPSLRLDEFMREHNGRFRQDTVARVDPVARKVLCGDGAEEAYDALVLAPGARRVAPFEHALVFGEDPLALTGILSDLEGGWSTSVAFVVPQGSSWPLPLYELALMTAEQVWGMDMERAKLHLVTSEAAPLDIFGAAAAREVEALLAAAGITVLAGATPAVERNCEVRTGLGEPLAVDRIVTLPLLEGTPLQGVPVDAQGFITVDEVGRVSGLPDVYAVGDAADHDIKQGGLACQQADVVAGVIAELSGARVDTPMPTPVLRGRLLTGRRDRFLRRELSGEVGEAADEPLWWPPAKVSGRYLAPYLVRKGLVPIPRHDGESPVAGVDVSVQARRAARYAPDLLGLDTLGRM